MGDWMFDDDSAASLLDQNYTPATAFVPEEDPVQQSVSSQDPLFTDDPPADEVDPITVWGQSGSDTVFNSGGVGWERDTAFLDPDLPEVMLCTPPPDGPTPVGVDMDELRRQARDLANDAAGRDDGVEWGGLIWMDSNGRLHTTSLLTSGNDETAAFALGEVAPGGVIVATYHTHPERNDYVNQGVLNQDDRQIVEDLQAAIDRLGLNVTIDGNAMMYVTDNENGVTTEFDVNDTRNAYGTVLGPCGS